MCHCSVSGTVALIAASFTAAVAPCYLLPVSIEGFDMRFILRSLNISVHCCVEFRELSVDLIRTRGNRYKLIQHHCHYDLRKLTLLTGLSQYGTVYLIMLSLQKQLTLLRTG